MKIKTREWVCPTTDCSCCVLVGGKFVYQGSVPLTQKLEKIVDEMRDDCKKPSIASPLTRDYRYIDGWESFYRNLKKKLKEI